jgi:nitroreductase
MADVAAAEHIGERSSELHAAGALEPVDIMALRSGAGRPFELKLGRDIALVNAAIATEHMVLQATANGLGTCWVHHFDCDQLRQEFGVPANFEMLSLLAVGWPAEHPEPRPRLTTVEWKRP